MSDLASGWIWVLLWDPVAGCRASKFSIAIAMIIWFRPSKIKIGVAIQQKTSLVLFVSSPLQSLASLRAENPHNTFVPATAADWIQYLHMAYAY